MTGPSKRRGTPRRRMLGKTPDDKPRRPARQGFFKTQGGFSVNWSRIGSRTEIIIAAPSGVPVNAIVVDPIGVHEAEDDGVYC